MNYVSDTETVDLKEKVECFSDDVFLDACRVWGKAISSAKPSVLDACTAMTFATTPEGKDVEDAFDHKFSVGTLGSVRGDFWTVAIPLGGLGSGGIDEGMEVAKPQLRANKAVQSSPATRHQLTSAHELYPDVDFQRIQGRVEELRDVSSDSEAVSRILGRSVQIVHQV